MAGVAAHRHDSDGTMSMLQHASRRTSACRGRLDKAKKSELAANAYQIHRLALRGSRCSCAYAS